MSPKLLLAMAGLACAARASALQPLDEFLRGARTASADNAEARAVRRQQRAEADVALGRALPRLSLRGVYTRNEPETTTRAPDGRGGFSTVTLTPRDQLDGIATLDVPLVDLSSFARIGAARTSARASERQEAATGLRVESLVSTTYHGLVASLALVEAARRAHEVSLESLRIAEQRHLAGTAAALDVDRARAEVERNVQQLEGARLQVALAARGLQSLSGAAPQVDGPVVLADDLRDEPPLEQFQAPDEAIPALAAAIEGRLASEKQSRASRLALVPSLGASMTERVTNAGGLADREDFWQGVLILGWTFDLTTVAGIRSQSAAAEAARAREQRVRLAARDDIHRTWATVRTNVARSRSARVQSEVSSRAAGLALDRYRAGAATQLDLLQAQRDAFGAEAARIQADAELVDSRAQLRLAAGKSLLEPGARGTP